ncbi:hypothetical protein [Sphaerisporangium aureirubrum]|uniref:DUF2267 domain-containing protein n=1 Tax=Sphaerisporangium aureirubrum TaxID=1544736 RepID=A0ABW1NAG6_9ACTN
MSTEPVAAGESGDVRSPLAWDGEPAAKLSEGDLAHAVAFLENLSTTSPGFLGRSAGPGGDPGAPEGAVREVTFAMPEALIAAVRARAGDEGVGRYVVAAVTRQVELDLRAELAALVGSELEPVSPDVFAHLDTAPGGASS